MHWHAHKGGAQHYRVAESRGEALPVAVAIAKVGEAIAKYGIDPAKVNPLYA